MNIFVYWNYKDNDSKRIYNFLNQTEFLDILKKDNHVAFYREFRDFSMDGPMSEAIQDCDVALFFTHGDDDAILKFRYKKEMLKKRFTLLDRENAGLLRGKKVVAICCRSAKELGESGQVLFQE